MRRGTVTWVARLGIVALLGTGAMAFSAGPASAHGEAAQDPFLKSQTLAWFDVAFDKTTVEQGETFNITGFVKVLNFWPISTLPPPKTAALGTVAAGPTVTVRDKRLGGEFVPQVVNLEIGKVYDFKVTLAGRRTGRWHVHPSIHVRYSGAILGPAQWVNVEPNPDYAIPIKLMAGDTINLENYNMWGNLFWALIMALPGVLLLAYWLIPRPLIWRAEYIAAGHEDYLLSPLDKKVTFAMGGLSLVVIIIGSVYATAAWDVIPIQVRHQTPTPIVEDAKFVELKFSTIDYDRESSTIAGDYEVTNLGTTPAVLQSYNTSVLSFSNEELIAQGEITGTQREGEVSEEEKRGYGAYSEFHVMKVEPSQVMPGETVKMRVTISDPDLTGRRIVPDAEVQTRLGGAFVFIDGEGNRNIIAISPEVISSELRGSEA